MTEDEMLKACPFCGSAVTLEDISFDDEAGDKQEQYTVSCNGCAVGDHDTNLFCYVISKTQIWAAKVWNARPSPTVPEGVVEALETACTSARETLAAQERGPQWYTKGENAMYQQVRYWATLSLKEAEAAILELRRVR